FEHGYCGMRFSCLMDTILHTCAQAKKEKKYIPPVYHSTLPKLTHYKITLEEIHILSDNTSAWNLFTASQPTRRS
ncbi:MAG: hypothetical protein NTX71_02360, partial [Candidatus Aureabacteria bacterium]|nr:hypothetical protein [Candidatus Auribacterota bacterium]